MPNILRELRNITTNLMNAERTDPNVGGKSLIALLIPSSQGNVNEEHTNFALEQLQLYREEVPDLRFIFWVGGSISNTGRFERFVREPLRDLFPLTINLRGIGTDSIPGKLFKHSHWMAERKKSSIQIDDVFIQ